MPDVSSMHSKFLRLPELCVLPMLGTAADLKIVRSVEVTIPTSPHLQDFLKSLPCVRRISSWQRRSGGIVFFCHEVDDCCFFSEFEEANTNPKDGTNILIARALAEIYNWRAVHAADFFEGAYHKPRWSNGVEMIEDAANKIRGTKLPWDR